MSTALEIIERYLSLLPAAAPWLVGGALVAALVVTWRRRALDAIVLGACLVGGAALAWDRLSVLDDAFISFRYAENLLAGEGLVYNPGEWVEGYTNFLWTLLLAAGGLLTPLSLPHLSLVLGAASFAGCLVALVGIGRAVHEGAAPPLAAALFAVQGVAVAYASTGLETMFTAMWALLGLWALVGRADERGAGWAGAALVAATLSRLDHALFWVAGAAAVAVEPEGRRGRLVAYARPTLVLALYGLWKLRVYGDLLPNTYYAKAANQWYVDQGAVYLLVSGLAAHAWVLGAVVFAWVATRPREPRARRLAVFVAVGLPLYLAYVAKVGGDYMLGRFTLVAVALLLAGAEVALAEALGRSRRLAIGVAVALGATAHGVPMVEKHKPQWHIGDDPAQHRLVTVEPLVVKHHSFAVGKALGTYFAARGLDPVIATCCIGQVGYYSGLEVVDLLGLTDPATGRKRIGRRGKPGHEKYASTAYMVERGVRIARWRRHPKRFHPLTQVQLPGSPDVDWHVFVYEEAFMQQLARVSPEVGFTEFGPWYDRYVKGLGDAPVEQLEEDLAFFDRYYFEENRDRARRRRLVRKLERARGPSAEAPG